MKYMALLDFLSFLKQTLLLYELQRKSGSTTSQAYNNVVNHTHHKKYHQQIPVDFRIASYQAHFHRLAHNLYQQQQPQWKPTHGQCRNHKSKHLLIILVLPKFVLLKVVEAIFSFMSHENLLEGTQRRCHFVCLLWLNLLLLASGQLLFTSVIL